jgi:hypothetical protein
LFDESVVPKIITGKNLLNFVAPSEISQLVDDAMAFKVSQLTSLIAMHDDNVRMLPILPGVF